MKNKQIKGTQEGKYVEKYKVDIVREQVEDSWVNHKVGIIKSEIKKEE